MNYFYKGFNIVEKNGYFYVLGPMVGNKVVKITKTKIDAKLWIERADSTVELRRQAYQLAKKIGT